MKRPLSLNTISVLLLIVALFGAVSQGQTTNQLEVTKNVNLRHDPSTANASIELLKPPKRIELIEPDKQSGYYHVRVDGGLEGWVWARNVQPVAAESVNGILPSETLTMPPAPSTAQHVLKEWPKFIPKQSTFIGTEGSCTADGNGGADGVQYIYKNRSDVPTAYHDVTFDGIDELPFPGNGVIPKAPTNRKNWLPEHFAITNPYESVPLRVEGYIKVIRDQTNGTPGAGEGTNCGFGKLGNIDAHIALVHHKADAEETAIVVEWTPRFTQLHPNWTSEKLRPWINADKRVRISGWLMVDPNHLTHITGVMINGVLRKFRHTLWEIHPITKIEVEVNGNFVDLDALP